MVIWLPVRRKAIPVARTNDLADTKDISWAGSPAWLEVLFCLSYGEAVEFLGNRNKGLQ